MRAWWVVLCLTGCLSVDEFPRGLTTTVDDDGLLIDGRRYSAHVDGQSGMIDSITFADFHELLDTGTTETATPYAGFTFVAVDQSRTQLDKSSQSSTVVLTTKLAGPVITLLDSEWTTQVGSEVVTGHTQQAFFPDGRIVRFDTLMQTTQLHTITSYFKFDGVQQGVKQTDGFCSNVVVDEADEAQASAGAVWIGAVPGGTFPTMANGGLFAFDLECATNQPPMTTPCSEWELETTVRIAAEDVFHVGPDEKPSGDCSQLAGSLDVTPPLISINGVDTAIAHDGVYTPDGSFGRGDIVTIEPTPGNLLFPGLVIGLRLDGDVSDLEVTIRERSPFLVQLPQGDDDRAFVWANGVIQQPIEIRLR